MADCGLRRIGALTGLGRIADCPLGVMRCKDVRLGAAPEGYDQRVNSTCGACSALSVLSARWARFKQLLALPLR
eukprot:2191019-Alexandrium_andersonii.AAC.1